MRGKYKDKYREGQTVLYQFNRIVVVSGALGSITSPVTGYWQGSMYQTVFLQLRGL